MLQHLFVPAVIALGLAFAAPPEQATRAVWIRAGSANPIYGDAAATGRAGYTRDQYTFEPDGQFTFYSKTFTQVSNKIILVRESGTYAMSGNTLTITPTAAVIEAWSKKDGTDKWGALISRQQRPLEKTAYRMTKHYFSGIQQWNLVLQADRPTNREGAFSSNTTFPNAYYYSEPSNNTLPVELPPNP